MQEVSNRKKNALPTCLLVIGMAGSGKTTFSDRFFHQVLAKTNPVDNISGHEAVNSNIKDDGSTSYRLPVMVNLDPAVLDVSYPTTIDITETVDYKRVMEQYKLGPNGAILTCLNLFTAQFDKVLSTIQAGSSDATETEGPATLTQDPKKQFVLFDTPGQIEVFTWSASGTIITQTLSALYPTVVLYVLDSTVCENPGSFISNMLYACSILYKTKLPFILVFNKTDETPHEMYIDWLRDFEVFQQVIADYEEKGIEAGVGGTTGFHASFIQSMSLVLEEFYKLLSVVGVSSLTGDGFDELLEKIGQAEHEYWHDFYPMIEEAEQRRARQPDEPSMTNLMSLAQLNISKTEQKN